MGKICFLFVTQRSSNNTLYIMFQCIMYHIVFTLNQRPSKNSQKQDLGDKINDNRLYLVLL